MVYWDNIGVYWDHLGVALGLFWGNGKGNGSYFIVYSILGG